MCVCVCVCACVCVCVCVVSGGNDCESRRAVPWGQRGRQVESAAGKVGGGKGCAVGSQATPVSRTQGWWVPQKREGQNGQTEMETEAEAEAQRHAGRGGQTETEGVLARGG